MTSEMTEYFVFLRGINVGGRHKVPMAALREFLSGMGFSNIRTVLNSGNVALEAESASPEKLESRLEEELAAAFGFPIPVMVREAARIRELLLEDPFEHAPDNMQAKWQVTFFKKPAAREGGEEETSGFEVVHRSPDLVCWVLDLETRGTPDAMKDFERWYGSEITTRTWQTLQKLQRT